MSSSIDEFDLPNDGDADGTCTSRAKGFVLHVDKCEEHDHWVHIHSSNKSEYVSETNTDITAGDDLNTTVGGNRNESVAGDHEITAENIRMHSEVFVKSVQSPGSLNACIENGMVDINKLAAWLGEWSLSISERVSSVESKV